MNSLLKIAVCRSAWILPLATMVALASFVTETAHAQWKWRDQSGTIHYSDLPPPAKIPKEAIIWHNDGRLSTTPPPAKAVTGDSGKGTEAIAKPNWRAKAEAMQKREAERAAKQAEEEQALAQSAELARACETLQTELRTLQSGMRVTSVRPDGERDVLDDAKRNARIDELQQNLEKHCSDKQP